MVCQQKQGIRSSLEGNNLLRISPKIHSYKVYLHVHVRGVTIAASCNVTSTFYDFCANIFFSVIIPVGLLLSLQLTVLSLSVSVVESNVFVALLCNFTYALSVV